jgi:TrmH family RNA methyltransferase
LRSKLQISSILAAEGVRSQLDSALRSEPSVKVALLPDRVFESVAGTRTSQGVIALVAPPLWRIEGMFGPHAMIVVLDGVQDPGNAGTLVRAAEAFGSTGVLFLKGSASPHHPKTLRASAGSLFRVPFLASVEPAIARAALMRNRVNIYAGLPEAEAQSLSTADFRSPCAFVIGNEGNGVGEEFRSTSVGLTIPTAQVESLNASIAGAIFLYEAYRQRHS